MKNANTLISSAIAAAMVLGLSSVAAHAGDKMDKMDMEKCYGVVKAGKNDCKTASNSCQGHSTKDGEATAFIAVPKGTCERIVGGNAMSPKG